MKTISIAFLFVVGFVCGVCFEGARWELATQDWINPAMIDTVENPFGAPMAEQQQLLDKMHWQKFSESETE